MGTEQTPRECGFITVPNLSAKELFALAEEKLELTFPDDSGYASYDFVRDEGGKTYQVMVWQPVRSITTEEVCKYFNGLGFDGNPAAFLAWATEHNPEGCHVSLPSDDSRLYRHPLSGVLYAPLFASGDGYRELGLCFVDRWWSAYWSFVAFREV